MEEFWQPERVALILAAYFIAGAVKGLIGMGLPVVTLAILGSTIGVRETLTMMVLPGFATNLWQALAGPAFVPLVKRFWSFLLAAVTCIWFGTAILATARSETLIGIVGTTLTLYSVVALARFEPPPPGASERWLSPLMGAIGGFIFGMAGNLIVPSILYLHALRLPRDVFVQALGILFITITSTLGLSLVGRGLMTGDLLGMSAAAVVPTALGLAIGARFRHHISEERFRRIFLIALLVVGLDMLRRALL